MAEQVPFSPQAVFDGYWELYHDDDCGETLIASPSSGRENSYCPKCKFNPDMQSLGARRTEKGKLHELQSHSGASV